MAGRFPQEIRSATGKLVYLYLSYHGATTLEELHRELDIPQLSLIPVVRALCRKSVLRREAGRYRCQ